MRRTHGRLKRGLRGVALAILVNALVIAPAFAATNYVVQPGDTFYQLSIANGIPLGALEAANPQMDPNLIHPGQTVVIPNAGQAAGTTATAATNNLSPQNANLLSQMIAAEASDQPYQAQVGVGAVIMNRLAAPNFPKTLAGIIFQPGQFTSVSNGWFYNAQPTTASDQAAKAAIAGQDPVGNALYFYEPAASTNGWIFNQPIVTRIGSMDFSL